MIRPSVGTTTDASESGPDSPGESEDEQCDKEPCDSREVELEAYEPPGVPALDGMELVDVITTKRKSRMCGLFDEPACASTWACICPSNLRCFSVFYQRATRATDGLVTSMETPS